MKILSAIKSQKTSLFKMLQKDIANYITLQAQGNITFLFFENERANIARVEKSLDITLADWAKANGVGYQLEEYEPDAGYLVYKLFIKHTELDELDKKRINVRVR